MPCGLRQDAEFLLQLEPPIEYICVSFVQKGQDLQELIDIMDRLKIPQAGRHVTWLSASERSLFISSGAKFAGEATQDLPED